MRPPAVQASVMPPAVAAVMPAVQAAVMPPAAQAAAPVSAA